MPVRGQDGDLLRWDEIAERRDHRTPTTGHVGVEEHCVRTGCSGLSRGGLTRREDHDEAVPRKVSAQSLRGSAVLADDQQAAQWEFRVGEHADMVRRGAVRP